MSVPQDHEAALFALALSKPTPECAAWLNAECEGGCGVLDVAEQIKQVVPRPAGAICRARKQAEKQSRLSGAAVRRRARVDLRHRQQSPIDQDY